MSNNVENMECDGQMYRVLTYSLVHQSQLGDSANNIFLILKG